MSGARSSRPPWLFCEPKAGIAVRVFVKKLFLLSPAKITGERAKWLLNPRATFAIAQQLHREGLSLADAFTFASGLYFRGKITYARQFSLSKNKDLIRIITTNRGLVDPLLLVRPQDLKAFGEVDIHESNTSYHEPLRRDAEALGKQLSADGIAILLGSIATAKYRDVLLHGFGNRLVFPKDFIGRGDMSRGALLLRAAKAGTELSYTPVQGAIFRGKRAPKVGPVNRSRESGEGESH
jgi:hypothetical protein